MANNSGAGDPEEQQNDLVAALKAARELGPDMDHAVASSYLEKQKAAAQAQAQAQRAQQQAVVAAPSQQRRPAYFMGLPIGVIIFIAILVATGGHAWWMFWVLFCFGGFGWWGWRHDDHVQRRIDRYEWRRARYGYRYGPSGPYDNGYGQAPTPSQPPQVQPPANQQPQHHEYD